MAIKMRAPIIIVVITSYSIHYTKLYEMNLQFLHQEKKGVDLMIWSKKIGY